MSDITFEIKLSKVFHALWRHFWAIILAAVLGGGVMFSCSTFLIQPTYKADALLYVNNGDASMGGTKLSFSSSDLTAAQSLVDTYIVILNSWPVLDEVMDVAGLDYSYDELKGMISAAPVNSTEVFSVTVTSTDPAEAERIANAVTEVLPNKIAEVVDGSSVRIVATALRPFKKASPNITMYTEGGILIGAAIACLIIIIKLINDTKVHDEDYLIDTYNIPVLAVIPDLFDNGRDDYKASYVRGQDREVK